MGAPAGLSPLAAAALAMATLLAAGCTKPRTVGDGEQASAPEQGSDVLGEAAAAKSARASSRAALASNSRSLGGALVAVVTVADVPPCERVCGRLGDCLLESEPTNLASRWELECLDLCVHNPEESPARAKLLSCDTASCGDLTSCAQRQWTALGEARVGPGRTQVDGAPNVCAAACEWIYSCLYANLPPSQARLESYLQEEVGRCQEQCNEVSSYDPTLVSRYSQMYDCLQTKCGQDPHGCMGF